MVDLPEPGSLVIENKEIEPPTDKIASYEEDHDPGVFKKKL